VGDVSHREEAFAFKRSRQCILSELSAKTGRCQPLLSFSDDPEFNDGVT